MPDSFINDIRFMDETKFWLWVIGGLVISAYLFYLVWRNLRRARIIEDTPTSKIRSAHQGYAELAGNGMLMEGQPVIAPLTRQNCLWYRYKIERQVRTGKTTSWQTINSGVSDNIFLLKDDTGQCVVDPDNAEVISSVEDTWYGTEEWPDRGPAISSPFGHYRYTEERLLPGRLYVLGFFKTLSNVKETLSDEVSSLLRQWKRDQHSLKQSFDQNGDEKIDQKEWEQVREAAVKQVLRERAERSSEPVTHMMVQPHEDRHPFIISSKPQDNLAGRYRIRGILSLAGSFLTLGASLAMLVIRLGGNG